MGSEI